MSRLPARLLVLLALLGALWHPLCACRGAWSELAPRSNESSCCTTPEPAPRTDPCGQPGGACDCERELVLASNDGDGGSTFRLPALDLPPCPPRLAFVRVPDAGPRSTVRATAAHPPDRTRPLPLRI